MRKQTLYNLGALALAILVLCLLATFAGAWTRVEEGGTDIGGSSVGVSADLAGQLMMIQRHMTFRNKSGSTMAAGDPVILDGTSITVVTNAAAANNMTIANSLSAEGGWHYAMVVSSANQGSSKTTTLTGTDQNGNSQSETVTFTATGVVKKSANLWKTFTDIDMANLTGNVQVYAYPSNGMNAAGSNGTTCIGIVTESVADNAEGEVATVGCGGVIEAACRGAAIIPGDSLSPAGSGYLDEDATATIALALEPTITASADDLLRVLLIREND